MTQDSSEVQQGFSDVSKQANDPALFFRMLDMQAEQPAIVALRRRAVELLDVAGGTLFLDVGSGTGEVARTMAGLVPAGGSVVGVDASPVMIAEARRRTPDGTPVEFREGDAAAIDFPDDTFDGAHCERVLQHLTDPLKAARELTRVVRPGRRVVIADTDWDTAITGPIDPDVDRRLREALAAGFPNGRIGRRLFATAVEAGLTGVGIESRSMIFTEWDEERFVGPPMHMVLGRALGGGLISQDEHAATLAALQDAASRGTFFASVTMFLVSGIKPERE